MSITLQKYRLLFMQLYPEISEIHIAVVGINFTASLRMTFRSDQHCTAQTTFLTCQLNGILTNYSN